MLMMKQIMCIILFFILVTVCIYISCSMISSTCENNIPVNNILWSKCYSEPNNYNLKKTEYIADEKEILSQIQQSPVIWIRNTSCNKHITTDLDILARHLDKISSPVTLITSDGDRAVPSSYKKSTVDAILKSPNITKWLTQNYDKSIIHKKLGHYPIGLDLHTKSWLDPSIKDMHTQRMAKVNALLSLKNKYTNSKKNRIFVDSHLCGSRGRRPYMHKTLKNHPLIDFLSNHVSFSKVADRYAAYRFTLSPTGRGLDCHRTWEIMLAGSIPIVEVSSLSEMYVKHNLPVVIIPDFKCLLNINESHLNKWWEELSPLTETTKLLPKFTPEYWKNNSPK